MKTDKIQWPCDLPGPAVDALLKAAHIHTLSDGDDFFIGKDRGHGIAYVIEGIVIGSISAPRKPSPFVLFDAGCWFGGSQIYEKGDFSYRFAVLEHAKVMHISSETIKNAAELYPEVYKFLYLITSRRASETVNMLFASSALKLPQKVAYFLLELSKRFPHVNGTVPMISVSQAVLAQVLGLSRPKLNQELNSLEQRKVISIDRKRICIIDPVALEQMLHDPDQVRE